MNEMVAIPMGELNSMGMGLGCITGNPWVSMRVFRSILGPGVD